MSAPFMTTRRAALAMLSVTATAWFGAARAQSGNALPQIRIGFQKGSLNWRC